ncbi:hypothetical protein KQI74_27980 [Paenibacillus barcinonensis]|uniref:hypothetical protein n=1 Tax=Paenibacillus barcinonensis TaxID=198119 RepID=UPI001C11A66C|nr:hypothetical protein [Paenibacillus barcinonensis]MBU5356095.1 hypothetical protein [Paenibacillus barcinonensis]
MAVPQLDLHKHNPGRDVPMPIQTKELPAGNIVETYKFGETTVHICDDFIVRSPSQIAKVIREMHEAGWAIIANQKSEAD